MPYTPLHFGPGLLIKSLFRNYFSLVVFITSQVIIDLETLWNIYHDAPRLHYIFHSFSGSLIPAFITILLTRPVFSIVHFYLGPPRHIGQEKPPVPAPNLRVTVFSALLGAWSHVFLDGIMHRDVTPFIPWSASNPFLRILSIDGLHRGCVLSGILGGIIWLAYKIKMKYPAKKRLAED